MSNVIDKKINKKELCLILTNDKPYDNYFSSSKYNILSNMSELNDILKNKKNNNKIICFLYFFRKIIEEILYTNEEVINIIPDFINKKNISDYFYLSLLIKNSQDFINYIYKIDLIKELKKKLKVEFPNNYQNIIISKIGIELINNYKNTDNYEESEDEELDGLEKDFLEVIRKNIFIFNELNLNYREDDILNKSIDFIYIEIIINLINLMKQKQFKNCEYVMDILKQLDLEHINLTEIMFNELKNELNKKDYILNYQINNPNDLNNTKKIKLYYFLLKYTLKDQTSIYQIEFLTKAKKTITKLIKKNITFEKNDEINYIIEKLVDSKYYSKLYSSQKIINNENIKNTNLDTIYTSNILIDKNMIDNLYDYNEEEDIEGNNKKVTSLYDNEGMEKILTNSLFLLKNDDKKNISKIY